MTQPDFKAMDVAQLRSYVLEHRDDQEAFNALLDQLNNRPVTKSYPCPNTPENVEVMKEAIRKKLGK
jgi:hypothetical protein